MATKRKPAKRPAAAPKRRSTEVGLRAGATTLSAKAFAAALARIAALERQVALLQALPIQVATGGDVVIEAGAALVLRGATVKLEAAATIQLQGAKIDATAGMVTVDTGIAKVSGVLQCDTLMATSVVASSYTPGAGNIW